MATDDRDRRTDDAGELGRADDDIVDTNDEDEFGDDEGDTDLDDDMNTDDTERYD